MLDTFGAQSAAVTVPSAELQLKLSDKKVGLTAPRMGMDSGKKLLEITGPALSKRKFLVGLDLLCLFLGMQNRSGERDTEGRTSRDKQRQREAGSGSVLIFAAPFTLCFVGQG
ncbi:hypothetical protein ILYODFUR_034551 [Ilyodon furcidens]|uniref:Uncharacterized protein n=1 Tax=Ilyodon furcidens TaxID=33524 RepID=A0ABV0VAD5_9TELE